MPWRRVLSFPRIDGAGALDTPLGRKLPPQDDHIGSTEPNVRQAACLPVNAGSERRKRVEDRIGHLPVVAARLGSVAQRVSSRNSR
jgi:hypothetical protein